MPPDDISDFLDSFQALLKYHPQCVAWIDRKGRMEDLNELSLTIKLAEEIIANDLTDEHHHRGPEPDDHDDKNGTINIFRCPIPGSGDAYVKIGLRLNKSKNNQLRGVIWSFKKW